MKVSVSILIVWIFLSSSLSAQVSGWIYSGEEPVPGAIVTGFPDKQVVIADENGYFRIAGGVHRVDSLEVRAPGYEIWRSSLDAGTAEFRISLQPISVELTTAVVTGTPSPVSVMQSPVKIEVISAAFLQSVPTQSVTESLNFVNGVQESLNCGVCATNDIHINGMEGPYTLVLIDGMPVMSALASVYGLSGIPDVLVDHIEVVRGPSSTVYGSEAMGGVVNIRTLSPKSTPQLFTNLEYTSHDQWQGAIGWSGRTGKNHSAIGAVTSSVNQREMDFNTDGFTDIPLITRYAGFMKWHYDGRNKVTLAVRPFWEDRWGGQLGWTNADKGGGNVYGESILTNRIEATSQIVFESDVLLEGSWVYHNQDSYYGTTWYKALQRTGYIHLAKSYTKGKHLMRTGTTQRVHEYADNSLANTDELRWIPGLYIQDEWKITGKLTALSGLRLDVHKDHGAVWAPQMNIKFAPGDRTTMRFNAGSGFRLVNLFAEDHAALTGSRTVRIDENLNPERSYTTSLDLMHISDLGDNSFGRWILNGFYTVFGNKILPDYNTDPDLIIYKNLDGKGIVRGVSFDAQLQIRRTFRVAAGVTWMEAFERESHGAVVRQLFTPEWSGNGSITWLPDKRWEWTGMIKWTGPMELPQFAAPYQRPERSQSFALCHIQIRRSFREGCNLFVAVKNVFNYTQDSPLVRPDKPFSDEFDTSYAYGPLQVRHWVVGVNWVIRGRNAARKNSVE